MRPLWSAVTVITWRRVGPASFQSLLETGSCPWQKHQLPTDTYMWYVGNKTHPLCCLKKVKKVNNVFHIPFFSGKWIFCNPTQPFFEPTFILWLQAIYAYCIHVHHSTPTALPRSPCTWHLYWTCFLLLFIQTILLSEASGQGFVGSNFNRCSSVLLLARTGVIRGVWLCYYIQWDRAEPM